VVKVLVTTYHGKRRFLIGERFMIFCGEDEIIGCLESAWVPENKFWRGMLGETRAASGIWR